jgi:hypothetical protein
MPTAGFVDHVDTRAVDGPLLTVRVNRLSDGGAVLGISWHHAVGDMRTFVLLMRALAGAETDPRMVEDRAAYLENALPPTDSGRPGFRVPDADEAAAIGREVANAVRANRTAQIYFANNEIGRLRAKYTASAGRRLSTNDVLTAHLTTALRRIDGETEPRALTIPVNLRRILDLPADVVGNFIGEIHLSVPPDQPADALAVDIRAGVEEFATRHLNINTNRKFLDEIGDARRGDCVPVGFDPVRKALSVTSWTRFGLYDLTFDGHRPVLCCPVANLQLPWICWLVEGFHGNGILATVVVPAGLASKLRGAAGQAALHAFRTPDDELPAIVGEIRKMA